jgi:lipoate-protein ligase A
MRWHLLHDSPADGARNMARDAALLDLAVERGAAFVRTYTWEPHALSFGANEPAEKRYDRALIERRGLAVVRRPTGGRAVWHAEELTYSFACPDGTLGSLAESYRAIHTLLLASLQSLGADLALADAEIGPSGLDAGACFAAPVGGEVVSALGKVVGSAQLRERGALLQHGSILLGNRQELVGEITRGEVPPSGAAALSQVLGRPIRPGQVVGALTATLEAKFGRLSPLDAGLRQTLDEWTASHLPRFLDTEWTWRR